MAYDALEALEKRIDTSRHSAAREIDKDIATELRNLRAENAELVAALKLAACAMELEANNAREHMAIATATHLDKQAKNARALLAKREGGQ